MGRRGLLPGGQWMSAFGSTQVVAWGRSVQLSQGLSLVTLWRYNFIRFYFDLTSRNRGWISQDPRKQDNEGLTRRRAGRSRSPDGLPTAR